MDPVARARDLCLRQGYGCAEATSTALQEHYSLSEPIDAHEAMALNGGIAYSGGTCGAITGAALAVGRMSGSRIGDRDQAKRIARGIVRSVMSAFATKHGATDCRGLTGYDLVTDHDEFLASGIWETKCMDQIEFVIDALAPLAEASAWEDESAKHGVTSSGRGVGDES